MSIKILPRFVFYSKNLETVPPHDYNHFETMCIKQCPLPIFLVIRNDYGEHNLLIYVYKNIFTLLLCVPGNSERTWKQSPLSTTITLKQYVLNYAHCYILIILVLRNPYGGHNLLIHVRKNISTLCVFRGASWKQSTLTITITLK